MGKRRNDRQGDGYVSIPTMKAPYILIPGFLSGVASAVGLP